MKEITLLPCQSVILSEFRVPGFRIEVLVVLLVFFVVFSTLTLVPLPFMMSSRQAVDPIQKHRRHN